MVDDPPKMKICWVTGSYPPKQVVVGAFKVDADKYKPDITGLVPAKQVAIKVREKKSRDRNILLKLF